MTRQQADNLPEFSDLQKIDYDYEEQVRGVYRTPATGAAMTGAKAAQPTTPTQLRYL